MLFSCGKDEDERIKERIEKKTAWQNKMTNWHRIFVIVPVRVENAKDENERRKCAWLQFVERKFEFCINYSAFTPKFRLPEND